MAGNRLQKTGFLRQLRLDALQALVELKTESVSSMTAIFVIALALVLPIILLTLNVQISHSLAGYSEQPQLTVFLSESNLNAIEEVSERLLQSEAISFIEVIPKSAGLEELAAQQGLGSVIDALETNPLPDVLLVTPLLSNPDSLQQLADFLTEDADIDLVEVDTQWLSKLNAMTDTVGNLGILISVISLITFTLIITNTVAFLVRSAQEDIRIQKLVGAPDSYILRPLALKGLYFGLGGGTIAIGLQYGFFGIFNASIGEFIALYGDGQNGAEQINLIHFQLTLPLLALIWMTSSLLGMLIAFLSGLWQLRTRDW